MNPFPDLSEAYDVVILGGALSGGATATVLLKRNPGIRILIIERNEKLTRRVGEATVEVSAFFMGRVLGLTQYLNENHIAKQGLRFWFRNDKVENLSQASELGARKAESVQSTGAPLLISANPGCSLQIASALAERGQDIAVAHTAEVLDASIRGRPLLD